MAATGVYYEVATKQLDAQMQQIDQFDAKLATMFASSSAILAIFAGLLTLTALPVSIVIRAVVLILLGLASLVYLLLLYCLFAAYRVGVWDRRPNLEDLKTNFAQYDEPTMQEWVANECVAAYQYNEPLLDRKARFVNWSVGLFPLEALLLVIAGVVSLLVK